MTLLHTYSNVYAYYILLSINVQLYHCHFVTICICNVVISFLLDSLVWFLECWLLFSMDFIVSEDLNVYNSIVKDPSPPPPPSSYKPPLHHPPNKLGKGLKGILNMLLSANTITTSPPYTTVKKSRKKSVLNHEL